ncbi:hypothetical protein Sjap_023514 [Stephania japonica]|uniref:Uncharacterized protein n=1 Tax=Stephania japonica TaxID=461633 RepID=A0AAP0EEV0_9MAGN
MGAYKAPGPDGWSPIFFQSQWEVVGDTVTTTVKNFFSNGVLLPGSNDTLLFLIPKTISPESFSAL